jgi:hypothetical protein
MLCLLAALALLVAACGGGSNASSDTDVNTLLSDTFKGNKKVESGKLDLTLRVDAKNAEGVNGPLSLRVSGPFESQGKQTLPKFKIDFAFDGAGQSLKAGLTSTGDKGFVNFQGSDYVVSDPIFKQFKAGYEQAQKQGNKQDQSLSSLGLDPRKWLTNPKNEGEAKVGDEDTIKITGGINVSRLLDDVNTALAKARDLGVPTRRQLPSRLTAQQQKQIEDAVKHPSVEIYTGKEDRILRRMVVALGIVAPKGSTASSGGSADIKFDLAITDLNQDQSISEPANPKPFDELASQLGGLGLGGLGGASGAGGSGSGANGASNNKNLEKYSKCVNDAGSDAAKRRQCTGLLTSP